MDQRLSPLGQAALDYARAGLHVFPCRPRDKTPLTRNGFKDAALDQAKIRLWWSRWPIANIGIATGASNLLVIDIDSRDAYEQLKGSVGELFPIPTPVAQTSKGVHLYFRRPPDVAAVPSSQGEGLDVRADGGYVIAPPSVHPNGNVYTWLHVSTSEIAVAPEWAIRLAFRRKECSAASAGSSPAAVQDAVATAIGKGKAARTGASGRRKAINTAAFNLSSHEPWSESAENRLRSALKTIDATPRDIWRNVGMALHDLDKGDPRWAARAVWDEWSATCAEKFDTSSQEETWGSFDRPYEGDRITVATILYMAKERGWVDPLGLSGTIGIEANLLAPKPGVRLLSIQANGRGQRSRVSGPVRR